MKQPKKKTRKPIQYTTILKAAASCLRQVKQWEDMRDLGRALRYQTQAEALIEILEVHNCGATGGFDKVGTFAQDSEFGFQDLEARFKWLKEMR